MGDTSSQRWKWQSVEWLAKPQVEQMQTLNIVFAGIYAVCTIIAGILGGVGPSVKIESTTSDPVYDYISRVFIHMIQFSAPYRPSTWAWLIMLPPTLIYLFFGLSQISWVKNSYKNYFDQRVNYPVWVVCMFMFPFVQYIIGSRLAITEWGILYFASMMMLVVVYLLFKADLDRHNEVVQTWQGYTLGFISPPSAAETTEEELVTTNTKPTPNLSVLNVVTAGFFMLVTWAYLLRNLNLYINVLSGGVTLATIIVFFMELFVIVHTILTIYEWNIWSSQSFVVIIYNTLLLTIAIFATFGPIGGDYQNV